MKVTILDGTGARKERKLSGKVMMDRVISGPVDHLYLTVAQSRVGRVRQWLSCALSTIQHWDQSGHVWFDIEDGARDSAYASINPKRFRSLGYSLTPKTVLHIEPNKQKSRQVTA